MRILHVASYDPNGVPRWRAEAMRRLGHEVADLDLDPLLGRPGRLAASLRIRALIGPAVARVNRALLDTVRAARFDLVWLDKPIWVRPATVRALGETGALVVSYNPDNPFGPRGDPGWRLFRAALPDYDAHVFANPAAQASALAAGARRAILMPVPYAPEVHFPPPDGWDDARRDIAVGFVGNPHDRRADFFRALRRDFGISVRVFGEPAQWRRAFDADETAALYAGGAAYNDDYRKVIWRTRINLGFVARDNLDSFAQRWFEIAGSAGFLLAERTDRASDTFIEGREAAFFDDAVDCAAKIRRYLDDPAARAAVAEAGHARAVASGYDNESRLRAVLAALAARTAD